MTPHPFTLRQLQYVVAVADALSFRKAAERCRVSQPSLSAQIAQVERALEVQLFERSRKGVLVTAAGGELVALARSLLIAADELAQAGRRVRDPLAGTLRLGIIPTLAPYVLPAIAPALRARFPQLTAVWREDKTDALMRALKAGAIDGALVALEAELPEVEHAVVAEDPFVLAAPPGHPLAGKRAPVGPAELRGAEVLLLDEGHCFRDQALEVCARGRAHEGEFRATSLTTLVQLVASGAGVTLLPAVAVATEAGRAGLKVRRLQAPSAGRTIALVWRPHSALSAALRAIAHVTREKFPEPSLAQTT
jgi:LysR family transcriptional regulator, hydrogen peroxide-inducible genes activator